MNFAAAAARRRAGEPAPLSFAQRRLWLLAQLDPASPASNLDCSFRISGPLRSELFVAAFSEVVRRHEPLRTAYRLIDGEPMQIVAPPQPVHVPFIDLRTLPVAEREAELRRLAKEETARPFDLEAGPVFRFVLVTLADDEHAALLTIHHIATDGWSLAILSEEIARFYEASLAGRPFDAPPLPITYAEYALAQHDALEDGAIAGDLAYWKDHLAGARSAIETIFDRPRPAQFSTEGGIETRTLRPDVLRALKKLARTHGATTLVALHATFYALLARYTGSEDIVVGSPIATRSAAETAAMIGFFVNTLALRADLSGDPSFAEIIARVKTVVEGGYAHADAPLERVVEALHDERGSTKPLVDVALSFRDPFDAWRHTADLTIRPMPVEKNAVAYDLLLECRREDGGAMELRFHYRRSLFDAATVASLADAYLTLVETVVRDPSQRLSELELLGNGARASILSSALSQPEPNCCVHHAFEARVAEAPLAPAIVDGAATLTYVECNTRANGVAAALIDAGVRPGEIVALCAARSADAVVAMLGILKAGAAYLPLDPQYPYERLQFMLGDARARAVLADGAGRAQLGSYTGQVLDLHTAASAVGSDYARTITPAHPAYLMYTSGSTGRPKGVVVSHRSVTNLTLATNYVEVRPSDRVAQSATLSFDAATFEIWAALLGGASLVMCPQETFLDPAAYASFLSREKISIAFLTPSIFNVVARMRPAAFRALRTLILGGEAPDPRSLRAVFTAGKPERVINGYGPTETTTFACTYEIENIVDDGERIPIGRPIARTRAYVLDVAERPVPAGATGELYIGGAGVSRGYHDDTRLTTERFLPDPYAEKPGSTMYRTGDRARLRSDGELEFLGRFDRQIKLRGIRVDLEEIEAVLRSDERIADCAVVVEGSGDERRLAAYVVARTGAVVDGAVLRQALAAKVPAHVVPATVGVIERLPLDPNGKVDTSALHAASAAPATSWTTVEPSILEYQLIDLWQRMLGVVPVGIHDDFFSLGGNSLVAARMIAAIEEMYDVRVPLAQLYGDATVARLAELLCEREAADPTPLRAIHPAGRKTPLFFLHGDFAGGGFYCRPLARALGEDQPLFVLEPHGREADSRPPTIEAMAEEYLQVIRKERPHGPYRIGGFCSSGLVAYEIARQLVAAGDPVDRLIIVDGFPLGTGFRWLERALRFAPMRLSLWQRQRILSAFLRRYSLAVVAAHHDPSSLWRTIRNQLPMQTPLRGFVAPSERSRYETLQWMRIVGQSYVPRRFPGRLHVLVSDEVHAAAIKETVGWERLCDDVQAARIPGDHQTCVGVHIDVVAERIREILEET